MQWSRKVTCRIKRLMAKDTKVFWIVYENDSRLNCGHLVWQWPVHSPSDSIQALGSNMFPSNSPTVTECPACFKSVCGKHRFFCKAIVYSLQFTASSGGWGWGWRGLVSVLSLLVPWYNRQPVCYLCPSGLRILAFWEWTTFCLVAREMSLGSYEWKQPMARMVSST